MAGALIISLSPTVSGVMGAAAGLPSAHLRPPVVQPRPTLWTGQGGGEGRLDTGGEVRPA